MSDLMQVCEQAARVGGQVLLDWRHRIQAREKAPRDLVTEADLASQRAIADVVLAAFPSHQILGEENVEGHKQAAPRDASGFRWIVDPLDGTVNYVHGLANFSVSLAVQQGPQVLCGVVYDPVAEECFTAELGQGAKVGDQAIHASDCTALREALVAASFPAGIARGAPEVQQFVEVLHESQAIRRLGSAALNLCYTAAGRLDAYWAGSVQVWDVAAGQLILREAGGVLTSLTGGPFDLEHPTIAAAGTAELHRELLTILGRA